MRDPQILRVGGFTRVSEAWGPLLRAAEDEKVDEAHKVTACMLELCQKSDLFHIMWRFLGLHYLWYMCARDQI